MKTLIIIILIIIAVGLYFAPDITKNVIESTGNAVVDLGKESFEQVKESESFKNITESIKDKITYTIEE